MSWRSRWEMTAAGSGSRSSAARTRASLQRSTTSPKVSASRGSGCQYEPGGGGGGGSRSTWIEARAIFWAGKSGFRGYDLFTHGKNCLSSTQLIYLDMEHNTNKRKQWDWCTSIVFKSRHLFQNNQINQLNLTPPEQT